MKIWLNSESTGTCNLERNFYPVIDTRKYTHIQLLSCVLHNSWFNITRENNVLKFRAGNKEGIKTMRLKPGNYNIQTLNEGIHRSSDLGKQIIFEKHKPTGRVRLNIPNDWEVMFKEDKTFAGLLGFDEVKATHGKYGEHRVNFLTVKKYIIHCDVIDRTENYVDRGSVDARPANYLQVLTVKDTKEVCEQVFYEFPNPVAMPIKRSDHISSIRIWITDQDGREIDFNGFPISICIELV